MFISTTNGCCTIESGVKYSHYDLLVEADPTVPGDRTIALPSQAKLSEFHTRKNQLARFFDSKTYFGRAFQLPKMKDGKLVQQVDENSFLQPVNASKMQNFCDTRMYEGKGYKFPVLKGRIHGTPDLTPESLQKFFNIPLNERPQPKATEISSADKQVQLEYESQPQSLEVASVLHDASSSTVPVETQDQQRQHDACEHQVSQAQSQLADDKPNVSNSDTEQLCVAHSDVTALENATSVGELQYVMKETCMEDRLFKIFQPILDGHVQQTAHSSSDSDVEPTQPQKQQSVSPVDSEQTVSKDCNQPQCQVQSPPPAPQVDSDDVESKDGNSPQCQVQSQKPPSAPQAYSEQIVSKDDNPPQCQVQTQPLPEDTHDTVDKCFALRLPNDILNQMFKLENSSVVMKWKHKIQADTRVCFVSSEGRTIVVATASLSGIDTISSIADLRIHAACKDASKNEKDLWRSSLLQNKSLFVWNFQDLKKFSIPLELPPFRGRSIWVSLSELKPHVETPIPGMDLRETCEFFLNRLPTNDYEKLGDRLRALDGCSISVGSTCSGTDICVGMMKATIAKLNEVFNASRHHLVYTFCSFRCVYIYINEISGVVIVRLKIDSFWSIYAKGIKSLQIEYGIKQPALLAFCIAYY